MKSSSLGKFSLVLALILWVGLVILYGFYHYNWNTVGSLYSSIGVSALILLPIGGILSLIAWIRDRFSVISLSFIGLLLFVVGGIVVFLP